MRIGLDIDGVVCDFANPANEYIANSLGVEPILVDRWDWYKGYGVGSSKAWKEFWKHVQFHETDFFSSLPPEPFAIEGIKQLLEQGHEVEFVTARPVWSAPATTIWTAEHGVPLPINWRKRKYEVPFDLYVDDSTEQVKSLREHDKRAVLMVQPHNAKAFFDDRVFDGCEFVTSLLDLSNRLWRESEARVNA